MHPVSSDDDIGISPRTAYVDVGMSERIKERSNLEVVLDSLRIAEEGFESLFAGSLVARLDGIDEPCDG